MNGINITVVKRKHSCYVFMYRDHQRDEVLRIIWRYADDPELDLTEEDAAEATLKIARDMKVRIAR